MPLIGGRGKQADINGEMDSLSLRISNSYQNQISEQIRYSVFNLDTPDIVQVGTDVGNPKFPFMLQEMPILTSPILVNRISMYLYSTFTSDTSLDITISTAIFEYRPDVQKFGRLDETLFSKRITGVAAGIGPLWEHIELADNEKFRLYPNTRYFMGIYANQSVKQGEFWFYGRNVPLTVFYNQSMSAMPSIVNKPDLTNDSNVSGFPNVIYSNSEAEILYPWP